jgi:hypothetical protein
MEIWKKKTGLREYMERGGEGAGGEDSKYSLRSIAALILIAGIPPHILHFTDFSLFLHTDSGLREGVLLQEPTHPHFLDIVLWWGVCCAIHLANTH